MSDHQPEWMPSHEDVEEQSDLHIGWVDDEAMDFLYHVGLRAQIAVPEEMQAEMLNEFGGGYKMGTEGKWMGHKIAALRKELA